MPDVDRKHPAETGDSEAVKCPKCNGTAKNQYGQTCEMCQGTGFLLQQRYDANGRAIRVNVVG